VNLILTEPGHYLQSMLDPQKPEGDTLGALSVAGKTLVLRNIGIIASLYDLESIRIPEKYPQLLKLVHETFSSISLEVCCDVNYSQTIREAKRHYGALGYSSKDSIRAPPCEEQSTHLSASVPDPNIDTQKSLILSTDIGNDVSIQLPLNSVLWFSKTGKERLYADLITYPWDFLNISQKILQEEIKESKISPTASIAKSSIVEGPCIISDDVIVDDFCKIKGPTYIGKGSYIGMGSLIRNCIFNDETRIGFHCEIGKSYFAGHDRISHQNVILDSIIGENVWFGGYSGTANVLLDRKNVKYRIGDTLVNTGTDHFGAVVGNNCAIGASVIILPGRHVSSNSVIQAGTLLGKC
jgi:UDP-N-acetylglucosamine diphosphorylase / glucose-1-phosphate thymidylyltransferase / UDP-N-acetylgalactosamine diphosphorylase / glucosamine-1-phosphate N-acetyltransferase / galactosamine-1-phosphate N-acetyltransferase